jgi:hypothetical protein
MQTNAGYYDRTESEKLLEWLRDRNPHEAILYKC